MDPPPPNLDLYPLIVGLAGGLALFLFGMGQMTDALKSVAGEGMRAVLARLTTNRFMAALSGTFITAVIQSSSVTTVLVVGFVSAGLMSLSQSIGVIMGANVGTTITAQIIAFHVTEYALILVAGGFALMFLMKRDRLQRIGAMAMGLGLVFFGMGLMGEATTPLRTYQPFIELMQRMDHPLWAMLAAAVFTALVQSSSATTGIVIVLASRGFITLEAGIALTLGANIGTCVTAILAALGKPRVAKQAAVVHVIFNVVGALIWVGLIGYMADFVRRISPGADGLAGVARLAAETPRQIANAHTLFNVANVVLFIGFTGPLAALISSLMPVPPEKVTIVAEPKYLDDNFLQTPALAIDRLRLEVGHLGELVRRAFGDLRPPRAGAPPLRMTEVRQASENVKVIYKAIVGYAQKTLVQDLSPKDTDGIDRLLTASNHLYGIAETIELNVGGLMAKWQSRGLEASEETRELFRDLHDAVSAALIVALQAVETQDVERAQEVIDMKAAIAESARRAAIRIGARLTAAEPARVETYRLEMEVIEILKRIYYFTKRIARTIADPEHESPVVVSSPGEEGAS